MGSAARRYSAYDEQYLHTGLRLRVQGEKKRLRKLVNLEQ
jgi:hypothetical protein